MDYNSVLKLHAMAKRRVEENAQRIAKQKRILATLKLAGKDYREAENILRTMQALQAIGEKNCERLQRQLNALNEVQREKKRRLHVVKNSDGAA